MEEAYYEFQMEKDVFQTEFISYRKKNFQNRDCLMVQTLRQQVEEVIKVNMGAIEEGCGTEMGLFYETGEGELHPCKGQQDSYQHNMEFS